jgi:hypothetical protein
LIQVRTSDYAIGTEACVEVISMLQPCHFHANLGNFSVIILNVVSFASHLLFNKSFLSVISLQISLVGWPACSTRSQGFIGLYITRRKRRNIGALFGCVEKYSIGLYIYGP